MLKISLPFNATSEQFARARELLLVWEFGLTRAALMSGVAGAVVGIAEDAAADTGAVVVPPPPNTPPIEPGADDGDGPAVVTTATHDAKGFPWDERIHSSNHALNKDGTWRGRRGVANATVTAVEAELRAAGRVVVPTIAPAVVPPAPPTTVAESVAAGQAGSVPPPPTSAGGDGTIPPAPPVSAPLPPHVPAPTTPVNAFAEFMKRAAPLLQQQKLTHPQLIAACKTAGAENLPGLAANPSLIPVVEAMLAAEGILLP